MSWLSSIAYQEGLYYGKPRIDFELLEKYHEGLICCSACIAGELPQLLLAGRESEAEELALKYKNLFGPPPHSVFWTKLTLRLTKQMWIVLPSICGNIRREPNSLSSRIVRVQWLFAIRSTVCPWRKKVYPRLFRQDWTDI